MKIIKRNLKVIMLSLGLAAAMLPVTHASAQVINLLDEYYEEKDQANGGGLLRSGGGSGGYSVSTEQFGNGTSGAFNIGTEQFGQNAPLGSGLFIMAAAGAAYALKKRKMNK
jgi:hypothetical protein